jgi:hypothetical protein
MKSFRKSPDTEGKFALTTPQNPLVNATPRELAALEIKQLQELSAATERKKQLAAAAAPPRKSKPPVLFADEATPTASLSEPSREEHHEKDQKTATPDESSSIPPAPGSLAVALSPNPAAPPARAASPKLKSKSKPKPKPKSKSKPSSRRRTVACFLPQPEPSSLNYHQRKCQICKHPQREEIEEDFINWCKADEIVDVYQLEGYRAVYRHAHATGLFERRRLNIRFAAETLVEEVNCVDPCADAVLRAIRTCTRLNDRGEWNEPPSRVIISSGGRVDPITGRPVADPLPALALKTLVNAQIPNQAPRGVEILLDSSPSPETAAPSSDRHFAQSEIEPK